MDAALVLAAVAVVAALASAAVSVLAVQRPQVVRLAAMPLLGLSGLLALVAGLVALVADGAVTATLPLGLPWLPWRVRLDALSGFFLAVIGVVTVAVGLYGPAYVRALEHGHESLTALGVFTGLFLTGMLLVVLADDAFLFMVAWELMALSSYFLVTTDHKIPEIRRAGFLYLLIAHVGAVSLLLCFGVIQGGNGIGAYTFDAMRQDFT